MITIYGINNCDVTQKAIKWLKANNVEFTFHDYKEVGIDKATLEVWLQHVPLNKLLNARSTTYRGLTEQEKSAAGNKSTAIGLMMKFNSLIKRPVWDLGKGQFLLGWDEKEVSGKIL